MEKQKLWKKFKESSADLGKSSVYESIILYYTMRKKGYLLKRNSSY